MPGSDTRAAVGRSSLIFSLRVCPGHCAGHCYPNRAPNQPSAAGAIARRESESRLHSAHAVIDEGGLPGGVMMVLGPIVPGPAPQVYAFAANGLAG